MMMGPKPHNPPLLDEICRKLASLLLAMANRMLRVRHGASPEADNTTFECPLSHFRDWGAA